MDRNDPVGSGDRRELELRQIEDRIVERLEKRLPKQRTWRNRLIKYGIIALVLIVAYLYFFSCDDSPLRGGSNGGTNAQLSPRTSADPAVAAQGVFASVSNNDQRLGCALFSTEGRTAFASNIGAPDCQQAIAKLSGQVTDKVAYKNLKITSSNTLTSGENSEVSSCALPVTGGPRLGLFILRKQQDGGWLITGHEKEPADCLTG